MEAVYLLKGAAFSLAINVITRGKEPRVPSLRFALSKNISKKGPEPQISPLRCAPVEMTKGRAALPATVVAEQDPLFIALGGPKAHDSSGRDDKGEGGASIECGCRTESIFHQLGWARLPMTSPVEMTKGGRRFRGVWLPNRTHFFITLGGDGA